MKIIFIHGNGGTDWKFAWTPRLQNELEKVWIENSFETFPDSVLARQAYRLPFLQDHLHADENSILVWWSSGATAAMKYAEQNKIYGSILIAPSYTDLWLESERVSGYFDTPRQWSAIKANQQKIYLFYSQNDEFIPLEEFTHIESQLSPDKVYASPDQNHFQYQDTFPELLQCIKDMIA